MIRGGNSRRFVLGHYTLTRAIEHIEGRVWGPRFKTGRECLSTRACVCVTCTAERALHGRRVPGCFIPFAIFHILPTRTHRWRCLAATRCSAIYGPGEHPNRLRGTRESSLFAPWEAQTLLSSLISSSFVESNPRDGIRFLWTRRIQEEGVHGVYGVQHRLRCFSMGASKCLAQRVQEAPIHGWEVEEDA